ncbi:MAG TPA: hypothetical protein VGR26_00110 [Acidimicrobiales bacterium]|nr:hypothetical protein [Acidimicrobiales bacterium]
MALVLAVMLVSAPLAGADMTLGGGADLGTAVATPTTVAVGANPLKISLYGTNGNIPDSKTGKVSVPTSYTMATDGTITAAATPTQELTFSKINYSNCPATGTSITQGCPANPFVVNATLTVAAGTPAGTTGTLKVVATPATDSGVNADTSLAVGYVRLGVAANPAPIVGAAITGSATAVEGTSGTYSIAATDDGPLTYAWSVVSGNASITGAANDPSVSVTFTDGPSTVQLKVIVSDGTNPAVERTLAINEANAVPTGSVSAAPTSVNEGSTVTVSITGATDPSAIDAASLKYSFACDGLATSLAATYAAAGTQNSAECTLPDNGTYQLLARVIDKDGGRSDYSGTASATNVNPTATFSAQSPIDEGTTSALALTNPVDPGTTDTSAGFRYSFACDGLATSLASAYTGASSVASSSCSFDDNGSFTVAGRILDKDNGSSDSTAKVVVNNVAPTATFNAPTTPVDEGSLFTISLSNPSDPSVADAAGLKYQFDCGTGTFSASSSSSTVTCSAIDNPGQKVQGKILDKDGGENTYSANVAVSNVAPALVITAPVDGALYAIGNTVSIAAPFTDPGVNDTHTCTVNWDDGLPQEYPATETGGSGHCNRSRSFSAAGVYTISITVDDRQGGVSTDTVTVVVYDPSAGFVTGGGWIPSPAGAYQADPSLSGKANFGFVSKYKKGATVPTGQTEFHFQAGNFRFFSDTYQWLVVSGPKGQYKGTGSVNGESGYSFLLTLTDGHVSGGGGVDKFRIKITNTATGAVVYDNQMSAPDDMDKANPQALGGGSIVIHTGK